MSVASLSCDVDWEIMKGQRGVRDGPNEFEGRMEVSGKVNESNVFCTAAGSSHKSVVKVAEKDLGDGAGVRLE